MRLSIMIADLHGMFKDKFKFKDCDYDFNMDVYRHVVSGQIKKISKKLNTIDRMTLGKSSRYELNVILRIMKMLAIFNENDTPIIEYEAYLDMLEFQLCGWDVYFEED